MDAAPDGGYGWVVAVCAGTIQGLAFTVLQCIGQIYANMLQTRSYTRSQVAFCAVLPPFLTYVLAIFANKLAELYSYKVTLFTGSALIGFGICLSSLATYNLGFLTLTFIIVGTGMSLAIFPCSIITGLYFTKRRPLAMGFMSALTGIYPFFMPVIVQYFLDEYHLEGTLLLWGAILLHGCIAAMLIREPTWAVQRLRLKSLPKTQSKENEFVVEHSNLHDSTTSAHIMCTNLKMIFTTFVRDARHFCNYLFLFLMGTRVAFVFIVVSVGVILPQFAVEQIQGLTTTQSAFLLSAISISDLISRFIVGWINNCISNRTLTYLFVSSCVAISVLLLQFTNSYPAILAVCAIFGSFKAYLHVTYILVMFDTFGPADAPGAIAIQFVVQGFCVLSSGPIMAWIRDLTGSYKHCFTFDAVLMGFTVLLWLFHPLLLRCKQNAK